MLIGALAALALAAVMGCGGPQATIRYMSGGMQEKVAYDSATYQLAKGNKVQVLYGRMWA